jgi:methylation protein EvaC
VARWLSGEEACGLGRRETFERFRLNVERSRTELLALLRAESRAGNGVVAYGATSKSTTVTNYCGIGPDLIEFVSDTTPIKQGKYTPGMHIPVRSPAEFAARRAERALLFAWNHAEEIRAKEVSFAARGGRWIVYVPRVAVI